MSCRAKRTSGSPASPTGRSSASARSRPRTKCPSRPGGRNTCRMTRWWSSSLLLSLALAFPGLGAAADWGVNVYGLSRHLDRAKARELHVDSELNPGLGLRYRVPRDERLDWIFNFVFFPKVPETNSIATLGFWLTLWPGGW